MRFDVVVHDEAIGFKCLYPLLAAAAVRIAVNVDDFSAVMNRRVNTAIRSLVFRGALIEK
ncbi:hypothetical protein CUN61_20380 [Pseudomonas arsenicoxydans]|uniref:Uncharacterized protein n=1 Tax=Pseudomonas arsenicoxydans TaxID=702115 RepID=A0A4P6G9L0_9PSED|nr:hypothetical protein CUN61_20380 [Pseudomonas arsenicoxydans]